MALGVSPKLPNTWRSPQRPILAIWNSWKFRQDDNAKAAFERELALDPGHAHSLAYLGDVELRSGNPEKALELLRRAIRVSPEIRLVHVDLGIIYAQQKHYPEALAEFRI